jgi:hypothetical protein
MWCHLVMQSHHLARQPCQHLELRSQPAVRETLAVCYFHNWPPVIERSFNSYLDTKFINNCSWASHVPYKSYERIYGSCNFWLLVCRFQSYAYYVVPHCYSNLSCLMSLIVMISDIRYISVVFDACILS